MNEYLDSIMDKEVSTLSPSDKLSKARTLLLKRGLHHVPIVDGRKLVGLITTWDLFKLESPTDYSKRTCGEIMSTHLAVLAPGDHIGAAAEVLLEHLFQAVPIVDDEHNFLGMVDLFDILKYEFKREYPKEATKFA